MELSCFVLLTYKYYLIPVLAFRERQRILLHVIRVCPCQVSRSVRRASRLDSQNLGFRIHTVLQRVSFSLSRIHCQLSVVPDLYDLTAVLADPASFERIRSKKLYDKENGDNDNKNRRHSQNSQPDRTYIFFIIIK